VYGSGVLVSSWYLLLRGILAALRQKFHLSTCPNFPGHLSNYNLTVDPTARDPISGTTAHRSGCCEISRAV
jgi:hypothetical protein